MNTTNVCIELLGFYVFVSQAIVNNWISGGPSTAEAPKFFLGCLALARALSHLGIFPRTGAELKVPVASKIREHSLKCKTHINVDNFIILDSLPSKKGILILESLHQKIKKPSIGTHEQSTPLLCFD